MDLYSQYIHKSRYARYIDEEQRREHWDETVSRYLNFMELHLKANFGYELSEKLRENLFDAILNFKIMPSMRAMMTAGKALARDNTAGYNCSYIPVDDPKAFDEAMHILMCGTGVGFSVERQYVNKLPEVPDKLYQSDTTVVVKDSKEGWSKALRQVIALLYSGEIPKWDTSRVRGSGARLKTFGGRASGPGPLEDLFHFIVHIFQQAVGRKLTSLEAHDIMCKIGEAIVVGGVRRSAMISLSNLSDDRMRHAKSGAWWEQDRQRSLSNNSACYTEKPDVGIFMEEWLALYNSKSGERGLFNREASRAVCEKHGRRDPDHEWGTNPCSEIILRPNQFCNLTEVVVRAEDTEKDLLAKVELATILGTIQSTLTNFPYLRKIWKRNTEEERLLGVSLTGIYDNAELNDYKNENLPKLLEKLRKKAISTNEKLATELDIPASAAITCVKPSGTVSQLVNSASGIHPRFAKYYIRRVRNDIKDPLTQHLIDAGVAYEMDLMNPQNIIFSFPQHAPEASKDREQVSSLDHLRLWLLYQRYWCEHKPSVTINVHEHEWPLVGAWVWEHFDEISGVSFLPYDGGTYRQAPYEEIDEKKYNELVKQMPTEIDWNALIETDDNGEGSQTLACVAGGCEL
jgi:ribonucleoside-diphosphate reductase alpha chain